MADSTPGEAGRLVPTEPEGSLTGRPRAASRAGMGSSGPCGSFAASSQRRRATASGASGWAATSAASCSSIGPPWTFSEAIATGLSRAWYAGSLVTR
ncbi:hypothetical protein [Streptomyces sp. NPDC054794]